MSSFDNAVKDALLQKVVGTGDTGLKSRESWIEAPKRCRNRLYDACPAADREVRVLFLLHQDGLPKKLRSRAHDGKIPLLEAKQIASQMRDRHSLTEESLRWAIGTWADALDISIARREDSNTSEVISFDAIFDDTNSEKEEKVKKLSGKVEKLRREKNARDKKIETLQRENAAKSSQITSLQQSVSESRNKAKQLQRQVNAKDQELASLKENPRHKVSALRKKIRTLEQEKTAKDDRIALLKRDMEKMHQSARRKLAGANSQDVKILSEHLSSLRSEKKQLRATIDDLQNRLSRMAEALEREQANGKRESEKQLRQYKKMFISRAQQLRKAEAEKKDLQNEVERLRALAETTARTPSSNGHPVAPDESKENMDAEHADIRQKLGGVFCRWCQQGTVILGRHYIFELTLQDVYRDATVRPIYPASEDDSLFQFERSGRPAIFWFVDIGGASFLLPLPRSDETFAALEPLFTAESQGRPTDLVHIAPAYLATSDNEYHVEDTGQLQFESTS